MVSVDVKNYAHVCCFMVVFAADFHFRVEGNLEVGLVLDLLILHSEFGIQ